MTHIEANRVMQSLVDLQKVQAILLMIRLLPISGYIFFKISEFIHKLQINMHYGTVYVFIVNRQAKDKMSPIQMGLIYMALSQNRIKTAKLTSQPKTDFMMHDSKIWVKFF